MIRNGPVVTSAPTIDGVPDKRKGGATPLDPETQRRIDDVRAGRSIRLWLDRYLTAVPEEIRELTALRYLGVGGTRIERLPPWLDELPNLEQISISNARISEFPFFLRRVRWDVDAEQILSFGGQLDPGKIFSISIKPQTSLPAIQRTFDLGRNKSLKLSAFSVSTTFSRVDAKELKERWPFFDVIDSQLDEFLDNCHGLRSLLLLGCPIGRVPEPIRRLRAVNRVILAAVWPADIPSWLFEAPGLTWLGLGFNELSDLPDSLSNASSLQILDLPYNRFQRIPEAVWRLAALETLNLTGCPIEEVPADILRLERLSNLRLSIGVAMPKELVVPPPEIAAQGLDAIKRYWAQERDAGVDYLAEAKLLIVGESGAGKTSLAKKILDPGYELDAAEDSTTGIDVLAWQYPASIRVRDQAGKENLLQRDFRVNIWDFGGQEIYHSTHQFFLTKRSVYVLVTDERKEDTDFEYWLEIVNLLSDGSPLLIVRNRKQKRQHGADLGALRQRYPNLCGILELDLADNSGLDTAVAKIRRELEQLPHIGTALPKNWRAVRLALEANDRNYISAADFFGICEANGFTDREDMRQLGGYLHDLGICLFFQDDALLSKTVILKPEWGTTAVYRVLDDPKVGHALGVFTRADLRRIWSDATYEPMRDELLQLMVKFQLCFQVPGSDTYIAPQLLAPSQPAYHWDESDNLTLRYEYDVMPKGIVRRLIVALHYQIAPGDLLWRSGAVFEYEGSAAEVIEVYRRRLLTIRIRGGDPRVLLGLIDHALGIIHRSYPGIKVKKFMPCDCATCAASSEPTMFEVGELKEFAQAGAGIQCRRSRGLRDPVELLRLLSPDALDRRAGVLAVDSTVPPPREEPVKPETFVSYSWGGASETLVDEIQRRMAERGVLITRDKNEVAYRDSIQQFMRRIGVGKCVVVILSKAYLESKNCMYELTQIASHPEFASRVYPIVMEDAGIFNAITRVRYIKYWEKKRAELDAEMKEVGQEHLEGIREELDLYEDIRNTIGKIMSVLGDMNTLTPEMHRGTDFEQLYTQLAAALQV
jgi:C-terminal of Roc, COR, domain/Ras of Complex, Roc, domain of DAPkinase/TIR domain/Leucine rich repeat